MKILDKRQIQEVYRPALALAMMRVGFIAYSEGRVQQPPVQHFAFPGANGDCCIKSGYLEGDAVFVIKVASGFYDNRALGLDSTQGMMMAFSAENGLPLALLMDEGWLTAQRTALAGQVAALALAPRRIDAIGIVGTGMQARLQLEALQAVTACRRVIVWGRGTRETHSFRDRFESRGYQVTPTLDAEALARACQLIVTCTPSTEPILQSHWIQPGTHITAAGADAEGKQELATALVAAADLIVVDSVSQCARFGEVSHAVKAGRVRIERLAELGHILAGTRPGRSSENQVTIADLTGLAIQDVQIAKSILLSGQPTSWCAGLSIR